MFGNGGKAKPARNGSVETLIGPRVVIRGDVHFSGGLYVEGTIQGAVIAEEGCADAVVTLADKGVIEGEVRAPHVVVNGQLRGDVYATGHIELAANARVQGNIYYQVVQMAAGAMLTGRLIHGETPPPKQLPKPEVVKQLGEVAA
jgi:cytoskeletal protein CcmA (bactofilin family)